MQADDDRDALENAHQVGPAIGARHGVDLDARFGEVDMLHVRIQELEERLDFAERLLAQARTEPARLEAPR